MSDSAVGDKSVEATIVAKVPEKERYLIPAGVEPGTESSTQRGFHCFGCVKGIVDPDKTDFFANPPKKCSKCGCVKFVYYPHACVY